MELIMFTFNLLIIFLFSSLDQMLAAVSPTAIFQNDPSRKAKLENLTFSARLIHHSSPESPFFNPNYTQSDYIKNSVRASRARSRYFSQSKVRSATNYMAAPVSGLQPIMKYTIGTPPVDRYGIFDTGSGFTWFQCVPCIHCYDQKGYPFFNPSHSTSYQEVSCNTLQCSMAPAQFCNSSNSGLTACHYNTSYVGGTATRGIVSMDTLTLSADNTTKTVENFVFGCANDSQDKFGAPGVVGLSNKSSSLLRQLGVSQFSYFLSDNGTGTSGEVHFGPGASLSSSGANTPFNPRKDGNYHLYLVGISVDGSDLDIPYDILDHRIVIDSGSVFSVLENDVFEKLKDALIDEMYMYTQVKSQDLELCFKDYDGGAPEVVFQFSGLDYTLCDPNLWIWDSESESHCLAIMRNHKRLSKVSVLGLYQQRNVQVGYDLQQNLLTLNYPDVCPLFRLPTASIAGDMILNVSLSATQETEN